MGKGVTAMTTLKKIFRYVFGISDSEYAKRMLTFIIRNCILMMWASYILAYLGMTEIAETLSSTIADAMIGISIGYFAKSTFENISKYTTAFGENIPTVNSNTDTHSRGE